MQLSEKRILELARSIAGSDPWSIGCVKFARLLEEEIARAQADAQPVAWMTDDGIVASDREKRMNTGRTIASSFTIPLYAHPSAEATSAGLGRKPTHEFVQFADRTRYVASIDPKAGIRPYPQAAQQQAETGKPVHPGDALGRCFDCMWAGKSKCPHTAQQQVEPVGIPAARNSRDSYSEGWNACRAAMLSTVHPELAPESLTKNAKFWHDRYREMCLKRQDDVFRLGSRIEELEEAAQQQQQQQQAEPSEQFEHLDLQNHQLRRAMQKMMARLTELLDEDKFAEVEAIAKSAGVEPPIIESAQ